MRILCYFCLALLLGLGLVGCGAAANTTPQPPTIHYGEDICEFCGMIISDERFAAGYLTADGQSHIFDDPGNMFRAYLQKQTEVTAFFVHDYEDVQWIRAETAHFVLSPNLVTPMLTGLTACATQERAKALAAQLDGEVLTFDEAMAHFARQATAPEPAHSH